MEIINGKNIMIVSFDGILGYDFEYELYIETNCAKLIDLHTGIVYVGKINSIEQKNNMDSSRIYSKECYIELINPKVKEIRKLCER